ncbi:hypothetical protein AGR13a_Lc30137 [Agrobacterium genomosp. 13 str. CFBP 6927]|uniref:Uncharacterized protein n=1 Tax=Agrobacterium genomosp. 13 str. CFBP 6927 TaxID=1183428 RepID=A0ABM9VLW2_9HYPH|nr:hypothetical protein AGR13a_Lc30137 [Agrobacterium genomosp. 13 str. CFBP 6927]
MGWPECRRERSQLVEGLSFSLDVILGLVPRICQRLLGAGPSMTEGAGLHWSDCCLRLVAICPAFNAIYLPSLVTVPCPIRLARFHNRVRALLRCNKSIARILHTS